MELYFLLILFLLVFVFWIFFKYLYTNRYKNFIKSFLNSNTNINILYNKEKICFINSIGLEFFSFNSVNEFNKTYTNLSQLFLSDEDCTGKHTYGKKWLEVLKSNNGKYFKVKLFSQRDKMSYYFNINISKIKETNQYLLSFNDITKLESEKANITKQAEYDTLTKIYNRVKFNEVLNDVIYRSNRYDYKFSIILLDIDHFKAINDSYGHPIGDSVLIELSRLINMDLESNDTFARWGGEEFVIITEVTESRKGSILALKLQRAISEYNFKEVGRVTCSFGVTEFKIGDTQALLFDRVDKALYEAKDNGRNQVVTK